MKIRILLAVAAALSVALAGGATAAQPSYPDKPIRIIVPTGAGGVTDELARALAQGLSITLGQSVFVDNRPGAGGIVGSAAVASAAPDGYTLLMAFPSHVANPSLYAHLPYDSITSFAPVSLVSNVSMVVAIKNDIARRSKVLKDAGVQKQ
jgi:tripartite-type tricarboxylate transporter receptor subunit TctC